jgi:hypothetical protein
MPRPAWSAGLPPRQSVTSKPTGRGPSLQFPRANDNHHLARKGPGSPGTRQPTIRRQLANGIKVVSMINLGFRFATAPFYITSSLRKILLVSRRKILLASRRKILLAGTAVVIVVIGLTVLVACIVLLTASSGLSDRLAAISDVVGAATLLLAMVAAVVALLAYAVSTGIPDLHIQLDFPFSELNKPSFVSTFRDNGVAEAEDFKQLDCTVRVRNDSSYSAKNPAVVVRLQDMAFMPFGSMGEWVVVQFGSTYGVTAVQWDGGANYSIHGGSVRTLPELRLSKLHTQPDPDPYITIDILADGYTRSQVKIPVNFKDGTPSAPVDKYGKSESLWL